MSVEREQGITWKESVSYVVLIMGQKCSFENDTLQDFTFQFVWLKSQFYHFLAVWPCIVGKQCYFYASFSEVTQIMSSPVFAKSKMAQNGSSGTLKFFWYLFSEFVRVQIPIKTLLRVPVSIFYCFQLCEKNCKSSDFHLDCFNLR